MFIRQKLLFAAILAAANLAAHADTVTAFTLNAASDTNLTVSGTLDLDSTDPQESTFDGSFTLFGTVFTLDGAAALSGTLSGSSYLEFSDNPSTNLLLFLPTSDLAGFAGGLCTGDEPCGNPPDGSLVQGEVGGVGYTYEIDSGTLTPAIAATPEPSSIALLGTGLLAAATLARRKLA